MFFTFFFIVIDYVIMWQNWLFDNHSNKKLFKVFKTIGVNLRYIALIH